MPRNDTAAREEAAGITNQCVGGPARRFRRGSLAAVLNAMEGGVRRQTTKRARGLGEDRQALTR